MALLEVNGIGKSFGTTKVLRDISFELAEGEALAIIGSSGSGKTTLLRCLNFLETADAGSITVAGETLWSAADTRTQSEEAIRKKRLHFGLVFQSFNLFNNMSVLKNCMVGQMKVLKRSKEEARQQALKYLEKVGMAPYINAKPRQISGGQKQRVAIAGVIAMEPECIVLDEATAMLDPIGRQEVLSAVHKLNREKGITGVLITHHMNEAEEADRVIVMDDGRIALDGTPKEVFTQVEPLRTMGLTVPDTVDLLDRLRKDGLDVPLDALTVDECAAAITAALAKN